MKELMKTEFAISINDLKKTYNEKSENPKHALKGLSIDIPRGSIFGLLGPNGAGKSTMINILAGLVNKTSGKVNVWGHDLDIDPRSVRKSIGVVPQELVVDTFFTVREALEFYAGYYGVSKNNRRTNEIIEAVKLTEQADISSRRLSGGMKRRLLVGKALVHNPPILILDEPTAGVDVELREQLWDYVRKLNNEGTTILLTTHYLEEAQELCDNIAIINRGELVAKDSTKNLMKIFDKKTLRIKFKQSLDHIPQKINGFDAVIDKEGALNVSYKPSTESVSNILDVITTSGLQIQDIAISEPDLEDVFKHLVAK